MASEGKCFTFEWKLKNIDYSVQKKGKAIKSPAFVVDAIEGTKWRLRLYPRGYSKKEMHIGYYLRREEDSRGGDNVEIKFELSFIGTDGRNLTNRSASKRLFKKGVAFGWSNISIQDVFATKRSVFLPNDILTFRCRIWKGEGEMTDDVKCTAFTRIGVEKRSYKWEVENFSTLDTEKKLNFQIKSAQTNLPLMSIDLSLTGESNSEEIIRFELYLRVQAIRFATLRLFLINNSGNRIECNHELMWFDPPTLNKLLAFTITKKTLLERKSVYLPNDTLSLIWEWGFSKGVVSEEPEEDKYGCICSEIKISDAQNSCDNQKALLNNFMDNVKCLYDQRFLSDVKLKTDRRDFPAHKFMLSACSSVFQAMFSCDMKEKITNCVLIEDLDDDTVSRMLHFIYTTRVEDLTWESANNLYVAADKYAIVGLKKVCSSFFKKNLSPNNACEVLLLADLHADAELKSVVQNYIMKNVRQISKSAKWKALVKTNAKLAAETVCFIFD